MEGLGIENNREQHKFEKLTMQYGKYKMQFLENIRFEIETSYTGTLVDSTQNPLQLGSNYSKF